VLPTLPLVDSPPGPDERPRGWRHTSGTAYPSTMWNRTLSAGEPHAYALLRVVSGLLFFFHGLQKSFGILGGKVPELGTQIWFGGWIELVAGLLIALGSFTRCAAFIASGTMAVAYTQFHWKLALGRELFPALNHGELSLLYSFLFLFIACKGDGEWSVGALRRR
jgi:putative oxidoreductase